MFFKISEKYAIKTDSLNYIFCTKIKPNKLCPDGWRGKWYYSTLKSCYNDLLEELTMTGDKETVRENLEEVVKLLDKLKFKALTAPSK